MTIITNDLLQALLSADAQQRQAAEAYLQSLTVTQRIQGLVQVLQANTTSTNAPPPPQQQLAGVLLRREIIVQLDDSQQLQALMEQLLTVSSNNEFTSATTVNNCLAEICASLQWLDEAASVATVTRILSTSAPMVSAIYSCRILYTS